MSASISKMQSHLLAFIRGQHEYLIFKNGYLEKNSISDPDSNLKKLVNSIESIKQFIIQHDSIPLTSEEKRALSSKIRTIKNGYNSQYIASEINTINSFQKVFYKGVSCSEIALALEANDFEYVKEFLKNSASELEWYSKLDWVLKNWISMNPEMNQKQLLFTIEILPYLIIDNETYVELIKRIQQSPETLYLDSIDLLQLDKNAIIFKCKHWNSLLRTQKICLKNDQVDQWIKLIDLFNQFSYRLELSKNSSPIHIIQFLNRKLANNFNSSYFQNIILKSQQEKNSFFIHTLLEHCFRLKESMTTTALLTTIFQNYDGNIFDYLDHRSNLKLQIRNNEHSLIHLFLHHPNCSPSDIAKCVSLGISTKKIDLNNETALFKAISLGKYELAKELIIKEADSPLQFIFRFNPPIDFIRFVQGRSLLKKLQNLQIKQILKNCDSDFITEIISIFPEFLERSQALEDGVTNYLSNPHANALQFETLFPDYESRYYREEWFYSSIHSKSIFFFLADKFPYSYGQLNKTKLLNESNIINSYNLIKLIKDGANINRDLLYQSLFYANYPKNFLNQLSKANPNLIEILKEDIEKETPFPNISLEYNQDILCELYDLFQPTKLRLLPFFVRLINSYNKIEPFFSFLESKIHDPSIRNFLNLRTEERKNPLLGINNHIQNQIEISHLQLLFKISSFKEIFGNDYLFLGIMIDNNRFDLFKSYLEMDPTIFEQKHIHSKGSFLQYSLIQVLRTVFLKDNKKITEARILNFLGMERLLQCLDIGMTFTRPMHINSMISNPSKKLVDLPMVDPLSHKEYFQNHLELVNKNGDTPLLNAAKTGNLKYLLYCLSLGANIDAKSLLGKNLFHLILKSSLDIDGKTDFFEYLANNGYECTSLLIENYKNSSPIIDILTFYPLKTVVAALRILSLNPPYGDQLQQRYAKIIARKFPEVFEMYIQNIAPSLLTKTSATFVIDLYIFGINQLRKSNRFESFELRKIFTKFFLDSGVDINLNAQNISFVGAMIRTSSLDLLPLLFLSKRFKPEKHEEAFSELTIRDLKDLYKKTNDIFIHSFIEKKLSPCHKKFIELLKWGFLKNLVDFNRVEIEDRIEDIPDALYRFNPAFYKVPICKLELPMKKDLSYYKEFLGFFEKSVPKDFSTLSDSGKVLSKTLLKERLTLLFEMIEKKTVYGGVDFDENNPSVLINYYDSLKNLLCYLVDFMKTTTDIEKIRSCVVDMAIGGPSTDSDGHCGKRWPSDAYAHCGLLGPTQPPKNISEWLHLLLSNFREDCFAKTVAQLNFRGTTHTLHAMDRVYYYLKNRGLHVNATAIKDRLVPEITRKIANDTFDDLHRPTTVYEYLLNFLNNVHLKPSDREFAEEALKGYADNLPVNETIRQLRSRQAAMIYDSQKIIDTPKPQRDFSIGIPWNDLDFNLLADNLTTSLALDEQSHPSLYTFFNPDRDFIQKLFQILLHENNASFFDLIKPFSEENQAILKKVLSIPFHKFVIDWLYSQNPEFRKNKILLSQTIDPEKRKMLSINILTQEYLVHFFEKISNRDLLFKLVFEGPSDAIKKSFNTFSELQDTKAALVKLLSQKYGLSVPSETIERNIKNPVQIIETAIALKKKELSLLPFYKTNSDGSLKSFNSQGLEVNDDYEGKKVPYFKDLAVYYLLLSHNILIEKEHLE